MSGKEQKKFEKVKKKEERKRRWTLLKAKLLNGANGNKIGYRGKCLSNK